ncbi:MAG: cellulase family glycosylhydrolase, partial [Bacteroidota bacterium]|nr:cellulase family glycosylhydrolase [Bacteroidota bacterium]
MKFKFVIVVLFSIVVNWDILLGKSVQNAPVNCVFVEQTGFPAIETSQLTFPEVEKILNGQFDQLSLSKVCFADLHKLIIEDKKIDLLIWPYGSAINEKVFEDILIFLQKGGNIIVTGGRPFSSDVEGTSDGYKLVQITNRFTKQLNIFDAQIVPAENIQSFIRNPEFDFLPDIKELRPQSAYSLLTFTGTDKSLGNLWGNLCSRFSTIISAADSTGTPAIPLISCFDHYSSDFTGGRWVFFTFTPQTGYWQTKEGQLLLKKYIIYASQKPFKADIVPGYAFYNPGELADFDIQFKSFAYTDRKSHIDVNVFNRDKCVERYKDVDISANDTLIRLRLKQAVNEGLYKITFTLKDKNRVIEKRIGGFICGDIKKLNSGIPFSTNTSFLTRGGSSYPVVGMTYMAAEKHRYFLKFPNPIIWDQEMKEMKELGVNMLRTGVWQWYPYELFMDTKGAPNEKTLRSLDAWLYTAKKYDLPVQYCLFPFQPQVIGCKAPYTDEQAFEVQQKYLTVLVKRYKNDPDIIWDLINEPTYGLDAQLWNGNIPTGSRSETKLWNEWLKAKYGDEL